MKRSLIVMTCILLGSGTLVADGYNDLDSAVASVSRGLERGDASAILSGVSDQIMLQFGDLMDESGFFSRDQASLFLEELFRKAKPESFEIVSARKVSSQGQYHITATWKIRPSGGTESREIFVTLQSRGDEWQVASIRSSSDR